MVVADVGATFRRMEKRLDVRDLVKAHVDAVRFAGKHPDLASFYGRRFRAFAAAFGIDDRVELERFGRNHLEGLAASTMAELIGLHSPFANYLEAPKVVIELHERYGRAISDALGETEKALEDLLVGIFVEMHGLAEHRTVTVNDLRSGDFDPSEPWPDEYDYW